MPAPPGHANLLSIALQPGLYRNGTEYQAEGRWWDCNLIRFYEGAIRPIGGWVPFSASSVTGMARKILSWQDQSARLWTAVGTHSHLYVFDGGGGMNDITPASYVAGRPDATNLAGYGGGAWGSGPYGYGAGGTNALNPATVWSLDVLEQYLVGCTAEDGYLYKWDLNTGHLATSLSAVTTLATAHLSSGSPVVTGITSTAGANVGDTLSGTSVPAGATILSVDSSSQITMSANATANTTNTITATGSAPINNTACVVTSEGFLMALGANGDPRNVMWADQDTFTVWTPSAIVQAGFYSLQTTGKLICGLRLPAATMLFCNTDVHLATYQGLPFPYTFQLLGSGCGVISRNAVAGLASMVVWMGPNGFWTYNGAIAPLACDVGDYVFPRMNQMQASKVFAVHNAAYGEVVWYYPSGTNIEIDSYVLWNYREGHWNIGTLVRTCGEDAGVFPFPIMVDAAGASWVHESGFATPGASAIYLESGPVEISETFRGLEVSGIHIGENVWDVVGMEPDARTLGDAQIQFFTKLDPLGTETSWGPYTMANPTNMRISGRQLRMKVIDTATGDWRFGIPRLDFRMGSKR